MGRFRAGFCGLGLSAVSIQEIRILVGPVAREPLARSGRGGYRWNLLIFGYPMRVFARQVPHALCVFGLSAGRKWGAALQHLAQIFPNPDRWLLLVNPSRTVPHSERSEQDGAKSRYSVRSISHHALSRASRVAAGFLPSIRRGTPPPLWTGLSGGLFGGPRAMGWLTGVPDKAHPASRSAQRAGRLALPGQPAGQGMALLSSCLGEQGVCSFRAGLQGLCQS